MRLAVSVAALATAGQASAETLLVPRDYPTIQLAVDAAVSGDIVLVAPGIYEESVLIESKAITLSGLAGRDSTVIDALGTGSVVEVVGAPGLVRIEFLTLQGGRGDCFGGGIRATGSPLLIRHCVIRNNLAECVEPGWGPAGGGGIYADSACTIEHSEVRANAAIATPPPFEECPRLLCGEPASGGGIRVLGALVVSDSIIDGNFAAGGGACGSDASGGGIRAGTVIASRTTISGNSLSIGACAGTTSASGGGIDALSVELDACRLLDNEAFSFNAAGTAITAQSAEIVNSLIASSSGFSGGVAVSGTGTIRSSTIASLDFQRFPMVTLGSASSVVSNSIVWAADGGFELVLTPGTVEHSLVTGGAPGDGNLDGDPFFVSSVDGDYRLLADSPCIDAGTNAVPAGFPQVDLDGNPRFAFGECPAEPGQGAPTIDIGCFEYRPPGVSPADLDGDCSVGGADLGLLLAAWGPTESGFADLNRDGVIDGADLGLLLSDWTE